MPHSSSLGEESEGSWNHKLARPENPEVKAREAYKGDSGVDVAAWLEGTRYYAEFQKRGQRPALETYRAMHYGHHRNRGKSHSVRRIRSSSLSRQENGLGSFDGHEPGYTVASGSKPGFRKVWDKREQMLARLQRTS